MSIDEFCTAANSPNGRERWLSILSTMLSNEGLHCAYIVERRFLTIFKSKVPVSTQFESNDRPMVVVAMSDKRGSPLKKLNSILSVH